MRLEFYFTLFWALTVSTYPSTEERATTFIKLPYSISDETKVFGNYTVGSATWQGYVNRVPTTIEGGSFTQIFDYLQGQDVSHGGQDICSEHTWPNDYPSVSL